MLLFAQLNFLFTCNNREKSIKKQNKIFLLSKQNPHTHAKATFGNHFFLRFFRSFPSAFSLLCILPRNLVVALLTIHLVYTMFLTFYAHFHVWIHTFILLVFFSLSQSSSSSFFFAHRVCISSFLLTNDTQSLEHFQFPRQFLLPFL